MENKELLKEIEDRFAHVYEEVIENIKHEIDERIGKRLDGLEKYLEGIVGLLEVLIEKK